MFHPGSYPGTSPGEKAIETGDHRGRRCRGLFVKSPLHFFLPFVFSSPGTEGAGMKEPFMEWKSKKATQLQASWRRLQKECGAQLIKWWRQQSHSWLCGPGVLASRVGVQALFIPTTLPSVPAAELPVGTSREYSDSALRQWRRITAGSPTSKVEVLFKVLPLPCGEGWCVEIALKFESGVPDTSPGSTYFQLSQVFPSMRWINSNS